MKNICNRKSIQIYSNGSIQFITSIENFNSNKITVSKKDIYNSQLWSKNSKNKSFVGQNEVSNYRRLFFQY